VPWGLHPGEETLADALKAAGYATHAIGKVRRYLLYLAPI
jgi:arylsulfatase A-like enzyme